MADRAAGVLPAGYCTIVLEDENGLQTTKKFEMKSGILDADCVSLADALQAITQLTVVDLLITRRSTAFTAIAAETNSAVAETASVKVKLGDGRYYTFTLPALKSALKIGYSIDGSNADLKSFLEWFDDGAGIANVAGSFYVSDGQEISETWHEDNKVTGKVNR